MEWIKRGRIFGPDMGPDWMRSHAQIPTVLDLGDRLRIYFASRPQPNLSLTGFLDVDPVDPARILRVHERPILELGKPGAFDAHGIMPQFVCGNEGQVWLYYSGWSRRVEIPYSNWTGLAVSDDGGTTFRKMFAGPIVDRTPEEIYSATGCYVLREGPRWRMWYASGVEWVEVDGKLEELYVIKSASSTDGIRWQRENRQLLPSKRRYEPTHRPTVLRRDGVYHMWFCHRGIRDFRDGPGSYRIGYASSQDSVHWVRDDRRAGIDVSSEGWDCKMLAYPYVLDTRHGVYLFYNGNGFGSSGFGFAVLDRSA